MSLQKNLKTLDQLVEAGKFLEAVEQFFHPEVIFSSSLEDLRRGKSERLSSLDHFFKNIEKVNGITLHRQMVDDNVTDSVFTFNFINKQGEPLQWHETIRRTWQNGKVVEERYLQVSDTVTTYEHHIAPAESSLDNFNESSVFISKSSAIPTVTIRKATTSTATPITDVAVKTTKTTVKAASKSDDLKIIEGIGPKIAELLNAAGITTFAQLASTSVDALRLILSNAGSRYAIHDPSTWAQQASLAAAGKMAELEKWQKELKAGKEA